MTPAEFTVSDLKITPTTVNPNRVVSVSVLLTNTGDLQGTYELTLNINGVPSRNERVKLDGGASQTVTFNLQIAAPGGYSVSIGSLSGTFFVVPPTPTTPSPTTPSPTTPTPTTPSPTTPSPTPTPSPTEPIVWGLIAVGVLAAALLLVVVWRIVRR